MAKRLNGEGNLRQKKDGHWEARLTEGYKVDGKYKIVYFYGRTRSEVKKKLDDYCKAKFDGIDLSVKYTFAQWADIWMKNHMDNISPTTQESYKYTLRILNSHFGPRKIIDIKALDIEKFLKKLQAEGKSDSGVAQCRGMLFQIFNKAEANDLIHKNPVRFADKMRSQNPAKEKEAFTAEEIQKLMRDLPFDRMGLSIRLMLGTGMRMQEMLALEPKHIEEDGSMIYIRQAVKLVKGSVSVGCPKSRDSTRNVPVPPNLRWCAVRLRETDRKYLWEVGVEGQPCNPTYFRNKFKEALEGAGVRVLTPHCCRHTYVSQMQNLGVDLETIKSIVGHAEIDMTQHYLHVQNPIRQSAVEKFSEAFENPMDAIDTPSRKASGENLGDFR